MYGLVACGLTLSVLILFYVWKNPGGALVAGYLIPCAVLSTVGARWFLARARGDSPLSRVERVMAVVVGVLGLLPAGVVLVLAGFIAYKEITLNVL